VKVKIEFDTDNAAFEGEGLGLELARVLGRARLNILSQMARRPGCVCDAPESADKLRDSNGNTIGTVEVTR